MSEDSSIKNNLDFILEQISILEEMNLKYSSIEKIKSHLNKLIKGYPFIKTQFRQQTIFRARKRSPNGDVTTLKKNLIEPHPNVKDLWYPPAEIIQTYGRYGRVNDIGKQIFYGSSNEETAIAELKPQIGDELTILECKLIEEQVPIVIAWGLAAYALDKKPGTPMAVALKAYDSAPRTHNKFRIIDEFLEKEFTKIVRSGNEHEYKISVAMFELLMEKEFIDENPGLDLPDGISYQSVTWQSGFNLALKPQSVDRLYQPIRCRMIVIRNKKESPTTYEWGLVNEARSISISNDIEWKWDDKKSIRHY